MNREQQEMALWLRIYERWYSRAVYDAAECGDVADYAVAEFRKRYPAEPAAPDQADNAVAAPLIALLDDIAGDSAFSGFGESMQSRIYAAIEAMRKSLPAAPEPVWYDEPPFARDGDYHPCWMQGATGVRIMHWSLLASEWKCYDPIQGGLTPLAGRRVCPIIKPQEPKQ